MIDAPRRILFVSNRYASDYRLMVGGLFRRMRLLLEAASYAARQVDVLLFAEPQLIERHGPSVSRATLLEAWGIDVSVTLAPRARLPSGRFVRTLGALADLRYQDGYLNISGRAAATAIRNSVKPDTDLVIAHRLPVGATAARAGLSVPLMMDLDDIEHRKSEREAANRPHDLRASLRRIERFALKCGELHTLARCDRTLVCSPDDRVYLEGLGVRHVSVVPNAVAVPARASKRPQDAALFFIGAYGYEPNVDAALVLIREILPRVRLVRPTTRLVIAGETVERISGKTGPLDGVEFLGFEPDLERLYDKAGVVCCPIRVGGGTRIKLIEAAMRAKPMVSTTIGAEGLGFADDTEILLADTFDAFAAACIRMLADPAFATVLGMAAQRRATICYERTQVARQLAGLMSETAARS